MGSKKRDIDDSKNSNAQAEKKQKCEDTAKPDADIALSSSGAIANILNPYGTSLSPSVTALQQYDLELGNVAADSMDNVYALGPVKNVLNECIGLPILNAKHYRISTNFLGLDESLSMGRRDMERTISIYGQRGSGKMLALKTFCLENSIAMVVISYSGFQPERDIKLAYEYAVQNLPCVVVLDECEGDFHPHHPLGRRNTGILQHWMDSVERSYAPLWTVIISTVVPSLETMDFAILKFIKQRVWCGDTSPADRSSAFAAAIQSYLYEGQKSPLDQAELSDYIKMSKHCTIGDVFAFVRKVFLHRAKKAGEALAMMPQTTPDLVPTMDDFSENIVRPGGVGRDRITDFDPLTYNIAPYTNSVNATAEESGWF